MKRYIGIPAAAAAFLLALPGVSFAQSGHFVQTQDCRDIGTSVECSGKVAGLGGETFEITVTAEGRGTVECTNPGGNVAPGQTFTDTTTGSSGAQPTTTNGRYHYTVSTNPLTPPRDACPNSQWTANVVDVEFTDATITLTEDGAVTDVVTVPVS